MSTVQEVVILLSVQIFLGATINLVLSDFIFILELGHCFEFLASLI